MEITRRMKCQIEGVSAGIGGAWLSARIYEDGDIVRHYIHQQQITDAIALIGKQAEVCFSDSIAANGSGTFDVVHSIVPAVTDEEACAAWGGENPPSKDEAIWSVTDARVDSILLPFGITGKELNDALDRGYAKQKDESAKVAAETFDRVAVEQKKTAQILTRLPDINTVWHHAKDHPCLTTGIGGTRFGLWKMSHPDVPMFSLTVPLSKSVAVVDTPEGMKDILRFIITHGHRYVFTPLRPDGTPVAP